MQHSRFNNETKSPQLKKGLLAAALGVTLLSTVDHASAYTLFDNGTDAFSISGRVAYDYEWHSGGGSKSHMYNAGTRVNVVYQHKFANDWTVLGRWEEGVDPLFTTHKNDNHFNRYRFISVTHPDYGALSFGRQNSVLYDFADVYTDQPWDYTDYTSQAWMQGYGNGNSLNGQRVDNALKYEVNLGKWSLGALYGTRVKSTPAGATYAGRTLDGNIKRKYMAQVGANYKLTDDLTLGAAYDHAALQLPASANHKKLKTNNWEVAINWTPGNWYLSSVMGKSRNLVDLSGDTYTNWDNYVSYTWPKLIAGAGDLQLEGEYSRYVNDSHRHNSVNRKILEAATIWLNNTLIVALDYMWLDDTKGVVQNDGFTHGKDLFNHNTAALMVRYNF
ncbi:hypothetical protein LMG33818_002067 [Halomonadaceae bacterium LMG 33818]|uniref:porin n=1 Tax=Cernens ardua TaxID=3402176 RepID=UPI003EDCA575